MYVCDADQWCRSQLRFSADPLPLDCAEWYTSFSPAMIHTYIHAWMINVYIDRQISVTPDHAILRWSRCTCRPLLKNKPRRCGRAIVSQLSAKASTNLPHTYLYTYTYIRQWLLLSRRVINIHHCKNVTPAIISIQKSTHTYIHTYKLTYIHTLEYMMYLVSGYQPQRRPDTAPSRNTEPKILTCRYKSQNYFNASACTVWMYVCMKVCTVCMYVFATFTGVPLQPLHTAAVSGVPQLH